jgi:tRNA-splicing ligase RtcB
VTPLAQSDSSPQKPTAAEGPFVTQWLVEARLAPKVAENIERLRCSDDVRHIAIMPDVHLGRLANNGVVVATRSLIYPQAIGSDIGCGLSFLRFNAQADAIAGGEIARILIRDLYQSIRALKRRGRAELPETLLALPLSDTRLLRASERDGAHQFGTLGCGNHFVELQQDEAGNLCLMVHSGSRGMGQVITEFHLARASTSAAAFKFLDRRTPEGQAYFDDVQWAVRYATLNRLAMMASVADILEARLGISADQDSYIDSPHNFARIEEHFDERLLVHRKSAISAAEGEVGLIAGSMGTPSFIVSGRGNCDSLRSSSHGAGRVMGRTEARRRVTLGEMRRQMERVYHDPRGLDALRDEAPSSYRDIHEVMRAQRELTRQVVKLTPLLNFKHPDPRSRA